MKASVQQMINEYACLRCDIANSFNGKMKLGCVAFSPHLQHQYVLRIWL